MTSEVLFQAAVEGELDEAVVRRTAHHVGAGIARVFGRDGKPRLKANIAGYNAAARHYPWAILVDLDREHDCAPLLRTAWLADEAPLLAFRIAVRQVESWILGDAEEAARFLGVAKRRIPESPDDVSDAKEALVNLARGSRRRPIRESIPPLARSGRRVGPLYNATLRAFVMDRWRPEVAAARSDSFARCLQALDDLRVRATAGR